MKSNFWYTHQSGNYLARDWHIEGWGSALISKSGMCLNIRPLPPNSWIKHWLGIYSRQSTNRDDQFPTCSLQQIHFFFFFKRMQIKVTVSQQIDVIKGWRQCGSWRKLGEIVVCGSSAWKTKRNTMIAQEDQPLLLYFPPNERLVPVLSQTHTHLALHSTFTVQLYIKHSSALL